MGSPDEAAIDVFGGNWEAPFPIALRNAQTTYPQVPMRNLPVPLASQADEDSGV
jgi:hypothetical protein